MLVLTRKVGEQLRIGGAVAVTVLGVRGKRVRLGLSGPPDIPIHREEVYRRTVVGDGAPSEDRAPRPHVPRPPRGPNGRR